MPSIPVSSPLSYLGIFISLFGAFLVLSGLNIVRVEKVSVTPGRATWLTGAAALVVGVALLMVDQNKAAAPSNAPLTPSAVAETLAMAPVTAPGRTEPIPVETRTENPSPSRADTQPAFADATLTAQAGVAVAESATPLPDYQATAARLPVSISDDFSDNRNQWYVGAGKSENQEWDYRIADGKYRMKYHTLADYRFDDAANFIVQDFWMSVDVTMVETDGRPLDTFIVLTFRGNENGNYYYAEFSMAGFYRLARHDRETGWNTIRAATFSPELKMAPGTTARLGVMADGPNIALFVNGTPLAALVDDGLPGAGLVGLGVSMDEGDKTSTVTFDNLEIRELRPPAAVRSAPVPPAQPASLPPGFLAALDGRPVTLTDDFSSNQNNWQVSEEVEGNRRVSYQIVDGKYRLVSNVIDSTYRSNNLVFKDFWLSLDATLVETACNPLYHRFNLTFRDNSTRDYYQAEFSPSGLFGLWRRTEKDGWAVVLPESYHPAARMQPGTPLHIGLLVDGGRYSLFANGQELATVEDNTLPDPGTIGFGIETGNNDCEKTASIDLDNLEIRALE